MYLEKDIEALNIKAYEISQFDELYDEFRSTPKYIEENPRIQKYVDEVYNELIKNISITSDIWLASYNKHIKDSQIPEIYWN
jgi:hypothetical protein